MPVMWRAWLPANLFASGFEVVAIAGSTLASWEWSAVLAKLDPTAERLFVRLSVSLNESTRRAQADSTRVRTKDAEFVRRHYERIDWQALAPVDLKIDTDGLTLEEVVEAIASRVSASRGVDEAAAGR